MYLVYWGNEPAFAMAWDDEVHRLVIQGKAPYDAQENELRIADAIYNQLL